MREGTSRALVLVATSIVAFSAVVAIEACQSASEASPAGDPNADSTCERAGNVCVTTGGGYRGGGGCYAAGQEDPDRTHTCTVEGEECCLAAFTCGLRPCLTGNTCDSESDADYCPGADNTPNCGSYSCLGACTCASGDAGRGCDCPACEEKTGVAAGSCKGVGLTYWQCMPASVQPVDAGSCSCWGSGECCCTAVVQDF